MTVRSILRYPDPRLRQRAAPIAEITPAIRRLADDMAESMYLARGVGLAAPQVGEAVRLFVVDITADNGPTDLRTCINPELHLSDAKTHGREGCLSFPGVFEDVERASVVTVRATDLDGQPFVFLAEGLLAVAVQHEFDHLNGVLLIDHLSTLKRRGVERAMRRGR